MTTFITVVVLSAGVTSTDARPPSVSVLDKPEDERSTITPAVSILDKPSTVTPPTPNDSHEMAKEYLRRFGHIAKGPGERVTDEDLERGLRSFQRFTGLTVTGRLDSATRELMRTPRCGLPDIESVRPADDVNTTTRSSRRRRKRFTAVTRWRRNSLRYFQHSYPSRALSRSEVISIIKRAFQYWTDVCCLRTVKKSSRPAHITLGFYSGFHGDLYPFTSPTHLAHTFYPPDGRVHFNDDEMWTNATEFGINLRQVAVHEIGHALGLGHTWIKEAVMFPYYMGYKSDFHLHKDDIFGIRFLYGVCAS